MEGPAKLADFTGTGVLKRERADGGEDVLCGLWQADDPEHAYDALHRLYMARERIEFRGPVSGAGHDTSEETVEVIILEWSNEDHPAALKLQSPAEES